MMPTKKALTLSLIIPVYNEADVLDATLQAIATQTEAPDEVIVVDNNSTDNSAEIAKKYSFVRVVTEKKQGQAAARNKGFNTAKSDILGRINADVILDPDWVERAKQNFLDSPIAGLAGSGHSALLPRLQKPQTTIWVSLYYFWMLGIFRTPMLWGANLAIRREAWLHVKDDVINDDQLVHEDQDLTLCILESGGSLGRDDRLLMTTSEQTYHYFPKLLHYTKRTYQTKRQHADRPAFKALKRSPPLWILAFLWVMPGMILLPIFFTVSFVFWPIDYVMKWVFHDKNWLS